MIAVKVVVPAFDYVHRLWAYDLANMASHTVAVCLANEMPIMFGQTQVAGTYLHDMRNDLLREALKDEATHVLWVDCDMRFPKDALLRLLSHNKGFVGINYSTRRLPPQFVAIESVDPPAKLRTTELTTGLQEAEAVGFGLALMDLRRLGNAVGEFPWFTCEYDKKGRHWGEDVNFCRRLRKNGVSVWVDHDLSKECAHIGSLEFTTQGVLEYEAAPVEA